METLYGLLDFDGIKFDHKKQHIAFLREAHSDDEDIEELLTGFENDNSKYYFYEYLLEARGKEKFVEKIMQTHTNTDGVDRAIKKYYQESLRKFSDTHYFCEGGAIKEIIDANNEIKKHAAENGVDYKTIIITSRAPSTEKLNRIYNDCHEKNLAWLKNNKADVDRIMYYKTNEKIKAVDSLEGKHLFFVEDHEHSLGDFLEKGIPSILVKPFEARNGEIQSLKQKHKDSFFVYKTHGEAANKMKEIYYDYLRE